MSITYFGISPVICFAVLFALTFAQGTVRLDHHESSSFEEGDTDAGKSNHSNSRSGRSTELKGPQGSFLAGEDTPVWIAYYADPKNRVLLTYRKLEKGIVKEAIDYWKSNDFNGFTKEKRSIDDGVNMLKEDLGSFLEPEVTIDARSSISHSPERPKREDTDNVYHPSVLAIMEYEQAWPSNEKDERKLILERIIYALAYWNSVDIQLRPIQNPWVRLHLAGIVIGKDRDATVHLFEAYGGKDYLHYEGTLHRMSDYWGNKMHQKVDFRRGTYNIVTLMTDEKQAPDKKDVVALSTDGLPCNHDKPGTTGVLITYDNLKFSGIQRTLHLIARILGHGSGNDSSCEYRKNWNTRVWSACDLDSIRKSLESNGWCMKEPTTVHEPGKLIEKLLPGSFMTLDEQCKGISPDAGSLCRGSRCNALRCQAKAFAGSPCILWNPAMDGSVCDTGKICFDGECVSSGSVVDA